MMVIKEMVKNVKKLTHVLVVHVTLMESVLKLVQEHLNVHVGLDFMVMVKHVNQRMDVPLTHVTLMLHVLRMGLGLILVLVILDILRAKEINVMK